MEWSLFINAGSVVLNMVLAILNYRSFRGNERFKADLALSNSQHLASLEHQSSLEMERFRSDLRTLSVDRERTLTRLNDKQAEVLENTYAGMVELEDLLIDLTNMGEYSQEPSKGERLTKFGDKYYEVHRYFKQHRLYLGDALAADLDNFFKRAYGIAHEFKVDIVMELGPGDTWSKSFWAAKQEIPQIRAELEREFKSILQGLSLPQQNAIAEVDRQAISE